jgi:hypothetical protein
VVRNIDKYRSDLDALNKTGQLMQADLSLRAREDAGGLDAELKTLANQLQGKFESDYQRWYTEACAVVRQLIPDRLAEFEQLYKGSGKRKEIDNTTFTIQDWLNGFRAGLRLGTGEKQFNDFAIVSMMFNTQLAILRSVDLRFQSSLLDIRQLLQSDLFDSELDAARELIAHGFLRAAGAVAGVVLEKHLGQVAMNHKVVTKKKHPVISDFNDLLKHASVVDVPGWRRIQRLADLRNLCNHHKDRDPTKEEVDELIDGVEKLSKTLF